MILTEEGHFFVFEWTYNLGLVLNIHSDMGFPFK